MKNIALILLLCAGCAGAKPGSQTLVRQSQAILQPSITWIWNPGGYSNFVVVTSTDLTTPPNQWPTYAATTDTNFQVVPSEPQRFFTLYGTNSDGYSDWVTK